jgi:hypothetical protein
MPFSGGSDARLPKHIKKRSKKLRSGWVKVFNAALIKFGEKRAFVIANSWLKKQLTRKKFIKRSIVKFDIYTEKGFIKRSRNGDEYITLVLNSTTPHEDGKIFSENMLKDWANQINKNPIVGDVDHKFYDMIMKSNMSNDMIKKFLKAKTGIAKTVRAVYKKGKLWVKAFIDKRYRKLIEKSKGVSAEAFYTDVDGKKFNAADLLGFTFNIKSNPADKLAGVMS